MTPTSPELPPAPDVARLDAARERVVRLLTDRYADDTLTVEEFEARLDRMHALASTGALDAMARELSAAGEQAQRPAWPAAPPRMAASATHVPAYVPAREPAPDRIVALLSSTRRSGAWEVPAHLRVSSVLSELVLDLRDAVLPSVCEIEVYAVLGNVKLRLPPGARARMEVSAVMANVDDHTRGHYLSTSGTGPRVRVTGLAVMAEVKVVGG